MGRKADFATKSLEEKEAALIKRQQVKKGEVLIFAKTDYHSINKEYSFSFGICIF